MRFKNRKGLLLIENLISVALLATVVVSILGGFIVAKLGAVRAKHRMAAMGLINEYIEKELASGYYFGYYYTFASATPVTRTIDNVTYSITPVPYPATESTEGSAYYKTVGFSVTWTEVLFGQAGSLSCNERAVTYIAKHA